MIVENLFKPRMLQRVVDRTLSTFTMSELSLLLKGFNVKKHTFYAFFSIKQCDLLIMLESHGIKMTKGELSQKVNGKRSFPHHQMWILKKIEERFIGQAQQNLTVMQNLAKRANKNKKL